MIYKVPCPSSTNGVRLFKEGNQIAVEYQQGEPSVSMAYDSALGRSAHTVSFREPAMHPDVQRIVRDEQRKLRRLARDDLPKGTGISRSKGEMNPRGSTTINDEEEDDDNAQAVVGKAMAFLKDLISDEDLERVAAILGGGDEEDADNARRDAADRAIDRRRMARLAADAARQRPMSAAENAEFDRLFPAAKLILRR